MGVALSAVGSAVVFQGAQQSITLAIQKNSGCSSCCENEKTYSQICAAHYTLAKIKDRLDACIANIRFGDHDSDLDLQKIFLDMSETAQIDHHRVNKRRGAMVVAVGIQCVLLVLLVLYLIFAVMRRSARTQANLDELTDQISSLQSQPL